VIALSHITPRGYHSEAGVETALVLVLLVLVLVSIEVLRAYDADGTRAVRRELTIVGVPLLVCSVAIVALRLVPLLN
jgi:hypothetical protein